MGSRFASRSSDSNRDKAFSVVRDRRRGKKGRNSTEISAGAHVIIARGPGGAFWNGSRYRIELSRELRVFSNRGLTLSPVSRRRGLCTR